jgi:FTR1 family protein
VEAFVITLREGVEAALILVLILTYLNRTGRQELKRWAYAGLGLAVVASILGAVGFSLVGFDPENELFEGILYGLAAVLVFSLVVWMWRVSRNMKQRVEGQLESLTTSGTQRQRWGLLAFVFFMVFREGVETVLFLGALSLTKTPDMVGLIGGLAGLALATLFGILFIRGSLRINLRIFFAVTSVVLIILTLRLAAGSVHEFIEVGLLPDIHVVEEATEFFIKGNTSTAILLLLVTLPVVALLPERWLRLGASRVSQ